MKRLIVGFVLLLMLLIAGCAQNKGFIDCGITKNPEISECFITAAYKCDKVEIVFNASKISESGYGTDSEVLLAVNGQQNGKCIFYANQTYYKYYMTKEAFDEFMRTTGGNLKENVTLDNINLFSNIFSAYYVGSDITCEFSNTSELIGLVTKYSNYYASIDKLNSNSPISVEDFENCRGELFGQGAKPINTAEITSRECLIQNGTISRTQTGFGTACYKIETDIGTISDSKALNGRSLQCCLLNYSQIPNPFL